MNRLEEIRGLREESFELRREIAYMKKEVILREKEIRVEEKKARLEVEKQLEVSNNLIERLKQEIEKAPYEQLTKILKALAVKLPTVDIKSLSVTTKGK